MTYKLGRCPTEGAGTAEIVYITKKGYLLVIHADGSELLHDENGRSPIVPSGYDLKPQREERVCWLYRDMVNGEVFAHSVSPDSMKAERYVCIGSALLAEGVHVPGTEPIHSPMPESARRVVAELNKARENLACLVESETPDYYDGAWHDWHGGECPVPDAELVQVEFTNGESTRTTTPCSWLWLNVQRFRVLRGPQP